MSMFPQYDHLIQSPCYTQILGAVLKSDTVDIQVQVSCWVSPSGETLPVAQAPPAYLRHESLFIAPAVEL